MNFVNREMRAKMSKSKCNSMEDAIRSKKLEKAIKSEKKVDKCIEYLLELHNWQGVLLGQLKNEL